VPWFKAVVSCTATFLAGVCSQHTWLVLKEQLCSVSMVVATRGSPGHWWQNNSSSSEKVAVRKCDAQHNFICTLYKQTATLQRGTVALLAKPAAVKH
jgi:hypothetical protein